MDFSEVKRTDSHIFYAHQRFNGQWIVKTTDLAGNVIAFTTCEIFADVMPSIADQIAAFAR